MGSINWTSVRADKSTLSGTMKVVLVACSGEARVYTAGSDDTFRTSRQDFTIRSNAQSHTIQFVDAATRQPDWVEIQTLTLLETDGNNAVGQWTRAVNNRDLPAEDGNRVFFEHGIGNFLHTSAECNRSMVHPGLITRSCWAHQSFF